MQTADQLLYELKLRACRAHELCNRLRIKHPEIPELGDDGELHEAIHDILRVDTPTAQEKAEPVDVESIREVIQFIRSRRHGAIWEQGAADKLDAAISNAPPAERVRVPDGWDIRELEGGFIHVESPQGLAVNLGYLPEGNRTASQLLQLLACALLSAAPEADHG